MEHLLNCHSEWFAVASVIGGVASLKVMAIYIGRQLAAFMEEE